MAEWFRDPGQLLGALKQHAQPGKRVPTIVGYDDLRELGRGGQGVVYTAVQVSTKRDVAIKLLLDGAWASDDRRRRFEREIDLIAALRHPNIVRLYDSGVTDEGYPYYVMEYIEGMCLDEMIGVAATASRQQFDDSLDARVLPPRDPQPLLKPRPILEVVAKVADAVHYAHQRGVIHRDLKPSNIRIDAEIEPQVLDFGLAKSALGVGLSDVTAPMSHTGEFMGSLPWASPEQAEGVPDKIDLRTDIYSLGVMLFQLLTGQFPYGVTGSFREVLDNILHTEPRRPSHVRKQIDDDVDTIVLKCLTKEPERRYQTAGELATDIRHYLAGEPIEAKRDSTLYNLRKTMRRYQYAARLIGVFTIIAIGTAIVTARLWIQAVESRQLAEDRLVAVEKARAEVVEARDRAERERNQALAINRFLTRMLESPMTSGREARVAEVLDQAAREVEQSRALEPDIEATLRATIGSAYYTLGMYPEAGEQLRRALEIRRKAHGEENAEVAASLRDLALFLCDTGDAAAAEPLCREALRISRQLSGESGVDVAANLNALGRVLHERGNLDGSEEVYREALKIRRELLGDEHESVAVSMNNLAVLLRDRGDVAAAEQFYRDALAIWRKLDEPIALAASLNNLGVFLYSVDRPDEAEPLLREALALRRKMLGEPHKDVATTLQNLATVLQAQGHTEEAEKLLREALAMYRAVFGDEHPGLGNILTNLGMVLKDRGDYAGAEAMLGEALELQRRHLGEQHPDVAATLDSLGMVHHQRGDLEEANRLYTEALVIWRELGGDSPGSADTLDHLALLRTDEGDAEAAERFYGEAVEMLTRMYGVEHAETLVVMGYRAGVLIGLGRLPEAEAVLRQVLDGQQRVLGEDHISTNYTRNNLAYVLQLEGRDAEAAELYKAALPAFRRELDPEHDDLLGLISGYGNVLVSIGRADEAEPLFREALEKRLRKYGETHLDTLTSKVDLATALLKQDRADEALMLLDPVLERVRQTMPEHWFPAIVEALYGRCLIALDRAEEAEPYMLSAYERLSAAIGDKHRRTQKLIERLVGLYEMLGREDEAAKFRAKLEEGTEGHGDEGT